jgi:hypothetical protein
MPEIAANMIPSIIIGSLYWEVQANPKNRKIHEILPGVLE